MARSVMGERHITQESPDSSLVDVGVLPMRRGMLVSKWLVGWLVGVVPMMRSFRRKRWLTRHGVHAPKVRDFATLFEVRRDSLSTQP
jgi:hypothetical protein